jgi:hypothetical protein
VTAGADVAEIARFIRPGDRSYRAIDVLNFVIDAFQPSDPAPEIHTRTSM